MAGSRDETSTFSDDPPSFPDQILPPNSQPNPTLPLISNVSLAHPIAFPSELAKANICYRPFQLMKSRTPGPAGQAPKFAVRAERFAEGTTTASWKDYAENKVVENWRESCVSVYETPYEERFVLRFLDCIKRKD